MPLSLSPLTKVISSAQSLAGSVSGGLNGSSAASEGFSSAKANLSGLVNNLGGGIGSALNGATAGLTSGIGGAMNSVGSIANTVGDIGRSINAAGLGGALGQLGGIAGAISAAAGQVNNVLSLFRGKNLPSAGELFQSRMAVTEIAAGGADDWRVRIGANFGLFGNAFPTLQETGGVVWPYTPKITVSTKAHYTPIDPVHSNYTFQAYKHSSVDDITISGEFTCETEKDAAYWLQATNFFKTATKMFFGASAYVGNPPIICQLSGYGPGVFNNVPIIIKSFSVDLPDDVNYIRCGASADGPTWVPIVSSISVTVAPIYNRTKLRQFSLQDYASGAGVAKGYI